MPEPLLEVSDLGVSHAGSPILSGVSFRIEAGSITGLFGESGCGKTTLALAVMGLLPAEPLAGRHAASGGPACFRNPATRSSHVTGERYRVEGAVRLRGRLLTGLREREMQRIRGASV